MLVRELGKKKLNTMDAVARENLIKESRKKEDKLIKGMFEFIDAQGGFLEFAYRIWPGQPIQMIKLIHGEVCDLPMGIVKHLNNTKKKVRRYDLSIPMAGGMTPRTFDTVSRVRFTPSDYL